MALTATLEQTAHLSSDDNLVANAARHFTRTQCRTLDEAEEKLKEFFHGWFVYRGGNHVAMHRTSGDDRRILFVTEA